MKEEEQAVKEEEEEEERARKKAAKRREVRVLAPPLPRRQTHRPPEKWVGASVTA